VGPITRLDNVENRKISALPGLELRPSCRSQSLYRQQLILDLYSSNITSILHEVKLDVFRSLYTAL
jgi:hypothetical protein